MALVKTREVYCQMFCPANTYLECNARNYEANLPYYSLVLSLGHIPVNCSLSGKSSENQTISNEQQYR